MTVPKTKKQEQRPIVIDLFAGAGGLSLGFEEAGFDVAAAVEIDPIHSAVHDYNFPYGKTICASVVGLTGAAIRKKAGIGNRDIAVVAGGPPCQGFSLIGKRALDDPRNNLVFHFVRLVGELKPQYFVFENVKGLTLGTHRKFLLEIIEALKSCGYNVVEDFRVLNAADYGVPQDRRRLILMGARKGLPLPEYPEASGRTTVAEAIGDIPDADRYKKLMTSDSVKAKFKKGSLYAQRLRLQAKDPTNFGYARAFDPDLLTSSTRTEHTELSKSRFAETPHGKTEPVSRFRKLPPDGLCNTLRAGTDSARGAFTSPRPIHPIYPRVITVREAARLHSYPDWFRFHATKWHGFRQIGNSVPPLLGRAVAGQIAKAMKYQPTKPKTVLQLGDEGMLTIVMAGAASHFGVSHKVIGQRLRKSPAPNEVTKAAKKQGKPSA
jgi:DNA (cytosine-5)-methyltransferase 1